MYTVNLTDDVPFATKLDVASFRPPEGKSVHVLGSWNGLLLVFHKLTENFLLVSPSTRECKKLPRLPFVAESFPQFYSYLYGGGYDSYMDDYKVVVIFDSNFESKSDFESESESDALSDPAIVFVYSLKTNAWRRIEDSQHVHGNGGFAFGVYFNGCLHWDCWKDDSYLVVAFDLADEVFREVPLPPASWVHDEELLVLGGCLCLVLKPDDNRQIEIWTMKEYGVRASWTKTVIKIMPDIDGIRQLDLLGLLAENEFVLNATVVMRSGFIENKLFVHNHQTEMLRDIVVRGIPAKFKIWGTYVESLLPRLS